MRWPESEEAGKWRYISSKVNGIQMLLIQSQSGEVLNMKIGLILRKWVSRQQDTCRVHHVQASQAAINAPKLYPNNCTATPAILR